MNLVIVYVVQKLLPFMQHSQLAKLVLVTQLQSMGRCWDVYFADSKITWRNYYNNESEDRGEVTNVTSIATVNNNGLRMKLCFECA
jgi:hypothetical protein